MPKRKLLLIAALSMTLHAATAVAGPVIINLTPINKTADDDDGIQIFDTDSRIENHSDVTTSGMSADGLRIDGDRGVIVNAADGRIQTSGDGFSVGIRTMGEGISIRNDGEIVTTGSNGDGIVIFGNLNTPTLPNDVVNTGTINVSGAGADSFVIEGSATTFTNEGTIINSGGVRTHLPDGTPVGHDNATGIWLAGFNNTLNNLGGTITNSGPESTAVRLFNNSVINNTGVIENIGSVSATPASIADGKAIVAHGKVTLNNDGRITGDVVARQGDFTVNLGASGVFENSVHADFFENSPSLGDTLNVDTGAGAKTLNGGQYTGFDNFSKQGSGVLFLEQQLDLAPTGTGLVTGGALLLQPGSSLILDTLTMAPGSILGGTGTVFGDVIVQGGGITPGFSPGEINIDGDLSIIDGLLTIEVGGTQSGLFDLINVTGAADITGAIIEFVFVDGFLPVIGDAFEFLQAASVTGLADATFRFAGIAPGFGFDVGAQGNTLQFQALTNAVAVSEPAGLTLGALGLLVLGLVRSRRARLCRSARPFPAT